MIDYPATWPDGTPQGGEAGYSPEWHEWAGEQAVVTVIKQMLKVRGERERRGVFGEWSRLLPSVTEARVKALWPEVTQQMQRRCEKTATDRNKRNARNSQ